MEYYAQLAAWVTAPHLKRPLDPRDLLKPEKKKVDPEKKRQEIRELEQLMGVS